MILAAGLGTRLRPWTLKHPKALVPVQGVPMLERVMRNLVAQGFDKIVVNVHHFAEQIEDYVEKHPMGCEVEVSDERDELLDTGGGVLKAKPLLEPSSGAVLVHNVDILSNADLGALMAAHESSGADVTLLVSDRNSSRKLIFDAGGNLRGWHNSSTEVYRPKGFVAREGDKELAFSGIYVIGEEAFEVMERMEGGKSFSIIDFLLDHSKGCVVRGYEQPGLEIIDIGKPETLARANNLMAGD